MPPAALAELVKLLEDGTLSGKLGKDVFAAMWSERRAAAEIVKAEGLAQVSDGGELEEACKRVVDAHPEEATRFRGGNAKLMGFFVGAVMKETGGKGNPKAVNEILRRLLAELRRVGGGGARCLASGMAIARQPRFGRLGGPWLTDVRGRPNALLGVDRRRPTPAVRCVFRSGDQIRRSGDRGVGASVASGSKDREARLCRAGADGNSRGARGRLRQPPTPGVGASVASGSKEREARLCRAGADGKNLMGGPWGAASAHAGCRSERSERV